MEKELEDLIKKYEEKGFRKGSELLLEPEIGLQLLAEFEELNIDRGFTGVHVWSPYQSSEDQFEELYIDLAITGMHVSPPQQSDRFVEGGSYLTLDGVLRNNNFASVTLSEVRIFLSERLDSHVTHISLWFEDDEHRNRRKHNPSAE